MGINEDMRDFEIRHQVGIQRLGTGIVRKVMGILNKADQQLEDRLRARQTAMEETFKSKRLRALLESLRSINRDAHESVGETLTEELKGVARYEAEFQRDLFERILPVKLDVVTPPARVLDAVVTSEPLRGKLLKDIVGKMEESKYDKLSDAINIGVVQGKPTDEIIREIVGTRARNYEDGILETTRVSAERVVRTATNHVSNAAREKLFAENADLVSGVQWVATLDTRTCEECGGLDGQVFGPGEGPRPPAHINCRCSTTPVVKSWRELGIDLDEAPEGTRASMDGEVPATLTYNGWLKKQDAATQDDALGPTRGALFRRGDLSVSHFTDSRGNQLTLDELREREAGAFRRANL